MNRSYKIGTLNKNVRAIEELEVSSRHRLVKIECFNFRINYNKLNYYFEQNKNNIL